MELVQRFKIREYETLQGFGHGVLLADCALKPLGKRGTSQRWLCPETLGVDGDKAEGLVLRAGDHAPSRGLLSISELSRVEAGFPALPFPFHGGKSPSLYGCSLKWFPMAYSSQANLFSEELLEPSPHPGQLSGE